MAYLPQGPSGKSGGIITIGGGASMNRGGDAK
jgi:hypothetical protein